MAGSNTTTPTKLKLTKTEVEAIEPEQGRQVVHWDRDLTGFGLLVSPGGAKTFFLQSRLRGKTRKKTFGRFGKITVDQARKAATEYGAKLTLGVDPDKQLKTGEGGTFGDMLTGYCDLLEARKKHSAKAVRQSLVRHVQLPHRKLWRTKAGEITLDDCMAIVRKVKQAGTANMANKVRSYIKSAFTAAINARGDTDALEGLSGANVQSNPAREIDPVEGVSNGEGRALSLAEFQAYFLLLKTLPEPKRSIGLLHVLTGGQRQRQLARVTFTDIDRDTMAMTIYDPKGKRPRPRKHVVPLLPAALDLIDGISSGPFAFTCNSGKSPVFETYIGDIAKAVCTLMKAAGSLEGEPFTGGAIRATVETRLVAKPYRVGSDVLAHLLSHGLGGVQQRHYNFHDYFDEKLEALQKLQRMVEGKPEPGAKVVRLDTRRAKG